MHYRMKESVRTYIHIFLLMTMLPIMAALTSCAHEEPETAPDFTVKSFSVSGIIYDSSESPGVPLEGVTVTLSAYWYFDTERSKDPIYTAVINTPSNGEYSFYKKWNMNMQNVYYVLKVTDESKARTVHFRPVEQEIYLRSFSDAYDSIRSSYEVRDNDFYLIPESF